MAVNDLEYKELRLDLVDLTEGVVGSFLFYYDDEVKKIYELPPPEKSGGSGESDLVKMLVALGKEDPEKAGRLADELQEV